MTAGRAPTSRRRHGASLGQIPLSSGEIELYSRQDEAARRRRRLLAVREQERRLAQQVTKRYRANLQQLQSHKAKKTQMQLSEEQHKMLTELHRRYQSSLQSMGTAQRNAREKLLELMEQAQLEQLKWTYNRQVTGEQRVEEAQEAQEEEEAQKLARRRLMEQNLQRLKELSDKQRAHASARAREEQEMALQRIKEREELDKLRRMNSPQEVFVTPRPHAEDVRSYRFTRTHCFVPPVSVVDPKEERPTVTVIKHNRNHPAAMHGVEEASKYREEMDQKRERDRLTTEERGETAAERGKAALHNVTSREKGQQALEWLALVDKLERRERGVNVAGGDDDLLAVVDAEGRPEDPERIAERVFAELLGLGDESLDLSAFSIETDEDDQSVGTPEADHVGADNPAKSNAGNREKNKPNLLGSVAEKKPGHSKPITAGERTKATRDNAGQPMKAKAGGDTQKRSKTNMRGDKDVSPDYIEVPFRLDHDEESVEQHDNVRKAKGDCLDSDADNVHQGGEQLERMKKGYHTKSAPLDDKRMPDWRNERRHSNTSTEERPEGIDSEDEAISQLSQGNESIPQQETRAQDDLDHLFPMLPQGRPLNRAQRLHGPARSWSSDSNVGEGGLKVDKTAVGSTGRWPRYLTSRESFIDSDEPQDASALPVTSDESDAISPRSSTSGEIFTSGGYQSASSVKGRYEKGNTDFIAGVRESGVSGAFSTDKDNRGEESILRGAPANLSGAQTPAQTDIHRRDDDTSSATSFIKGSSFDDISPPESPVEPVRLSIHAQHNDGVNYHDELGRQEVDARSEDHEPRYPGSVVSGKEDANSLHRNDEVVAPLTLAEEKSLPQSDQPNLTTISAPLQRDEDHSLSAQLAGDEDNVPSEVSVNTGYDEMQVKAHAADSQSFQAASVDKDDLSSSGSFAPSQKSLSRLPPNTSKPLAQRFIDEHMLSFSSSEGLSEDSEDGINRRALGPDIANPSVNLNPYDRYRRQINHQAQRRSTSASSIAQYSLPPSDSHSSIDDSLDRLHPDHGEDSFVNELVPMFPKNTISQSLDDDDQALEQYDVQLVAPNMIADERRKDPSAVMGNVYHFEGRRSWHSSTNESLEEHNSPSPRSAGSQAQERESERDARDDELDLTDQSVDGHRNIENTGEANREEPTGTQCTAFDSIKEHVALLPPPPLGLLDMSQPPAPLQKLDRNLGHSSSSSEISEWDHARLYHKRRLYEAEEERKRDDSSSESGVSSSDGSFDSSRSLNTKRAERMDISLKDASDDADGRSSDGGKNISLAEAFQRRHPRFHDRIESHRDKLKRQREKQQEQQREQEEVEPNAGTKSSAKPGDKVQRHKSDPKSSLSQPKQALLDRLATGSRAKISSREMKERSRRLYHQLPEVVERKRQEEMLRRRRQRLDELREQEKERRLQQKQRRQQQLQHKA
ncbi:hypothetical protein PHYBOEH_000568 [Phytophthora boehmeriae]|uniref:ALMS motif domain-containing protein n=1 Tax=Phytophthora boehmeriae TaxID=109152 RepID=A0A8T1XDQ5_9STRA|nr:hypothetical protein PHYBOEH_000568 [Phytophthora boehmeriae]